MHSDGPLSHLGEVRARVMLLVASAGVAVVVSVVAGLVVQQVIKAPEID